MDTGSDPRFELVIPPRMEFLAVIRRAVEATLDVAKFGAEAVDNLRLVLSETVTNAVKATNKVSDTPAKASASATASVASVRVAWVVSPGGVEVTVMDAGGGFDVDRVEPRADLRAATGLAQEGGFGLGLISQFADEAVFVSEASGTTVRFVIRRT